MWLCPDIHRLYGGAIAVQQGIGVGKGPQHAVRGFAGALGLLAAKIVKPAAGMGVNQGQCARLLLQGPDKGDEQAVLHDISAVTGMEGVAIIHWNSEPWQLHNSLNWPGDGSSLVIVSLYRLAVTKSYSAYRRRIGGLLVPAACLQHVNERPLSGPPHLSLSGRLWVNRRCHVQ